jgi:hypothetical protein
MPRDYIPQSPDSTEAPLGDPGHDGPNDPSDNDPQRGK